jgi:hypothetical protein
MNASHGRWIVGLVAVVTLAAAVVWFESNWKARNAAPVQQAEQAAPAQAEPAPAEQAPQPESPPQYGELTG